MIKLLILGGEGMLGREILQYAISNPLYDVHATIRGESYTDKACINKFEFISNFDALCFNSVRKILDDLKPDIIINCIGAIKHLDLLNDQTYMINSLFPRVLEHWCNINTSFLIHFSTDCVFDGCNGPYNFSSVPDETSLYGLSKSLGEVKGPNSLTLRTSIIGHESKNRTLSLMDWFLSQTNEVQGYSEAFFSGLTTTYLSNFVFEYIVSSDLRGIYNIPGPCINKFDLLNIISDVYEVEISIHAYEKFKINKCIIDKTLFDYFSTNQPSWNYLIKHLKENSIEFI